MPILLGRSERRGAFLGRDPALGKLGANSHGPLAARDARAHVAFGESRFCECARSRELRERRLDGFGRKAASTKLAAELAARVLTPREEIECLPLAGRSV
jgi:hypothetical protein